MAQMTENRQIAMNTLTGVINETWPWAYLCKYNRILTMPEVNQIYEFFQTYLDEKRETNVVIIGYSESSIIYFSHYGRHMMGIFKQGKRFPDVKTLTRIFRRDCELKDTGTRNPDCIICLEPRDNWITCAMCGNRWCTKCNGNLLIDRCPHCRQWFMEGHTDDESETDETPQGPRMRELMSMNREQLSAELRRVAGVEVANEILELAEQATDIDQIADRIYEILARDLPTPTPEQVSRTNTFVNLCDDLRERFGGDMVTDMINTLNEAGADPPDIVMERWRDLVDTPADRDEE